MAGPEENRLTQQKAEGLRDIIISDQITDCRQVSVFEAGAPVFRA